MKHLESLIARSSLANVVLKEEEKYFDSLIAGAFEELNEIEGIEPILKVVSNSNDLNIVFDFNLDSIEQMVATVNGGRRETELGNIYIAAKGLMRDEERFGPLSSLAQEFCRYSMELVYSNDCKPYNDQQKQFEDSLLQINKIFLENHEPSHEFMDAVERIKKLYSVNQEFEDILQATKILQKGEPNVSRVFVYPENQQHAELITRVPYLIVAYHRNQEKLNEIKRTFSKLFHFYEVKTLLDFKREFPVMKMGQEVKELNEMSGLAALLSSSAITFKPEALSFEFHLDRVSVITSNCTLFTARLIHQQLSEKKNFEASYIFIKLESLKTKKVFDSTIEVLNASTKPAAIINCGNESVDVILNIVESFKINGVEQRLVFIQSHETFHLVEASHFIMTHSWTQLTEKAQNELSKLSLEFQGNQIQLQDILNVDSIALKLIPLNDLLEGKITVGKALKFNDDRFHIERKFSPANGFEINSEELLKSMEKSKVSLLTAEPGMGKSSELKAMATKLSTSYPYHWIVFIDFKELEIEFKRERKISKVTKSNDELSRFFNEKVLKIIGFEAKVFSCLLNEDRVVFLMDGMDEASQGFKQFSFNLILSLAEKTSNFLWISSRTHMEKELKIKLQAEVYNLLPFSIYDQKEFLSKFFKAKNVEGELLEMKLKTIEKFTKTLEENSPTCLISNPLVLGSIAEIFEDETEIQQTEINLYTVFESFTQKKISNFIKKSHGPKKEPMTTLVNESMTAQRFHHRQALKIIFGDTNDEQLIQECFKDSTQPPFVDMANIGLINFLDNNKTLQFVHRSIAEFLCADFIFKKIFLANKFPASEKRNFFSSFFTSKRTIAMFVLMKQIFERGSSQSNCKMIRIFLDSKLKNLLSEKSTVYIKRVETIILKTFSEQELQNIFRLAVEDGLINLVHVLSRKSFWGTKESLNGLWIQKKNGKNLGNPLLIALERQPVKFLDNLLIRARLAFESEVFKKGFREVDELGRNIFHCAAVNQNSGVFEFLLSSLKPTLTEEETKNLLLAKDETCHNFLMNILKQQNIKNFQSCMKVVENNFGRDVTSTLLTNVDSSGRNVFHYASKWIRHAKDIETFWSTMKQTFVEDQMKELFCEIDEFGQTPMIHVIMESNAESFEVFKVFFKEMYATKDERREALIHESNEGFPAFHYVTRNKCKEVFRLVKQNYQMLLSEEELKSLILRENYEGENILFFSWRGSHGNIGTLEVLWSFLNELFDKETLKNLLAKTNYIGKTVAEVIANDVDYEEKMNIFKTLD